jgi:diacylglycerol kinase (ATP)
VICGRTKRPFLEVCSVGLLSTLFPPADDIQHGNLVRIGDFLDVLVTAPAAEMRLLLDNKRIINTQGHVVLVTNMPYIGPHFNAGDSVAYNDGLLDVIIFADLSKLELLGYAVQEVTRSGLEDPRIQRHKVRKINIETFPALAVMADGVALGEAPLRISILHQAVTVMAGQPKPVVKPSEATVLED